MSFLEQFSPSLLPPRPMNTRFLETFVTLAKLRSFRTTATALHATPAAISQRLKALEEELQTTLVDRESRDFRLTANGEYLLGYAKAVVEATRQLQAAASHEGAMRGKLRLGVIETVVHSWLADYMRRLADDFPQLEVELTVDVSVVLQRRLMAGELDLIIRVEGSDEESVVCDALANYPVHWIARAGLLPLSRSGLAKRVLRHPILTFGRGTAPHRALEDIVGKLALANGVPLADTRITGSPSISVIVQLVRDGFGVAAIPRLFVDDLIARGEVVELPLQPSPPSIVVSMSRRADAPLLVHGAANAARAACHGYCELGDRRLIERL
ncbi:DNA-binding transcriptional LysR family regulator [Paraburkholderia youngii]